MPCALGPYELEPSFDVHPQLRNLRAHGLHHPLGCGRHRPALKLGRSFMSVCWAIIIETLPPFILPPYSANGGPANQDFDCPKKKGSAWEGSR